MLLFILIACWIPKPVCSFNTSHVTLYLQHREGSGIITLVSIHLMLLFIQVFAYIVLDKIKFQYISCYSLSELADCLDYDVIRFNTSHVTLYLATLANAFKSFTFQYISCYSLSILLHGFLNLCYCFNTSHVTLYPSFYRLFFF